MRGGKPGQRDLYKRPPMATHIGTLCNDYSYKALKPPIKAPYCCLKISALCVDDWWP